MPLTKDQLLAVSLVLTSLSVGSAFAESYWTLDEPGLSQETTGTVRAPFMLGQAPSAAAQMPAQLAQAPGEAQSQPTQQPQEVDESALRYFARQGDRRRLEAEIARLRALYPNWTPPADPLAAPVNNDDQIEAVWQLYSEGRLPEAREAIAARQQREPNWQPPADLLERLSLAEARERLINASNIDQFATVIAVASENPQLLTCAEVDVLWRVAEAFAKTERPARARDAYGYVLSNCENPQERLATMQNASQSLPEPMIDELLAMERTNDEGVGEFSTVRDSLARDAVARGDEDASLLIPQEQLTRVERLAREGEQASDALLLGWYHIRRENFSTAEEWFRIARERQDSAEASQGYALALVARSAYAEAEETVYPWRDENDEVRAVYLAAVANLLGVEPRVVLAPEVLSRIVAEVAAARDVPSARQLGWYARGWQQHETAGRWFETTLRWDPDDEPAAYGLALTRHQLEDASGLQEIKRLWSGRSERIQAVGTAAAAMPSQVTPPEPATPVRQAPSARRETAAAPAGTGSVSQPQRRACPADIHPETLSPQVALDRGWCLMDRNRPLEAAKAFDVALRSPVERLRRDASYGQSLAYLRAGLTDEAALAAAKAPQDPRRATELQASILAERALGAYERGRYVEALIALDQRARIASERVDLLVLRGYAYLRLNRLSDAQRVMEAAAGTGNREGLRGLAAVRQAMGQ